MHHLIGDYWIPAGCFAETMQAAQLMMGVGFLMLGWVLVRRQMKAKKRINREARDANRELKKIREHREPAMPLADAPPETQRWQVAMFDLQRELKAELDTRISIVQTLIGQLDQRLDQYGKLSAEAVGPSGLSDDANVEPPQSYAAPSSTGDAIEHLQRHRGEIGRLARTGLTASEIAEQMGLPIADVEISLGTIGRS